MSTHQLRTAIDTRLAAITDTAANLKAQLNELNRLRDQIMKAQQLAPENRGTQTILR
jgi:hypothetical protein